MKNLNLLIKIGLLVVVFLPMSLSAKSASKDIRINQRIDKEWLFYKGDITNGSSVSLDDTSWRRLNIPHDWSIEGEYSIMNPTGIGGGYLPSGVVWYRKHLDLPKNAAGKRIFVEFTGVMENSKVWVNGEFIGERPYGYSGTIYDITDHVSAGKSNLIAVRVDTSNQPASRWYTGAGIFRHVNLIITDQIHFDNLGVFVYTPEVSATKAVVKIESTIINKSNSDAQLNLIASLAPESGNATTKTATTPITVKAGETANYAQEITIENPELWDVDDPNLYEVKLSIASGKKVIDDYTLTTGLRKIEWKPETGFWLNDKNIKINGLCMHHDGGAVGAAVPASVWERRLLRAKEMGANAIRTAHNPMDKAFFEICDRLGVMVMSEAFDCWEVRKNPHDYARVFNQWWERDLTDLVLRSRNHPSVIIYSVGNEIHDPLNAPESFDKFKNLRDLCHKLDNTRPVTLAVLRPNQWGVYDSGFAELMDVVGQNYRENEMVAAWHQKPSRTMIGTENNHNLDSWLAFRDNAFISGHFIWAGWQYLGESFWPHVSFKNCLFDRNGNILPLGRQRQSWWDKEPMVHITRQEPGDRGDIWKTDDWNPDFEKGEQQLIEIYTNCDNVELQHNGKTLGIYPKNADDSPIIVNVNAVPGELKAIARNNGKVVAEDSLKSAGRPVKLEVKAERNTITNNWDDVVYVNVTIVDENGLRYPSDSFKLNFKIEGAGDLVAVDNGYFKSHEKFVTDTKASYKGRALAIVRANASEGEIKITVSCDGFESGSDTITIIN